MYAVELAKLTAQRRVTAALGACLVVPLVLALALTVQDSVPSDTLFGQWVHESGYALPLVVLGFSGQWAIPILVSVVAGDSCAGEDHLGTWSLLLTRSRSRGEVLTGKVLAAATYCLAVLVLLSASSMVAGLLLAGSHPLVGLSGALLSPGTAVRSVLLSWLAVVPPTFAFAAIALTTGVLTRSSWVGVGAPVVLVLVLNLIALISAVDPVRAFLPTTGFEAWHGLVRDTTYTGPVLHACLVSAAWVTVSLVVAARALLRRDVVSG